MGKKSGVRKKKKVGLVWSGLVKDISNLGLHQIRYIHISYLQSRCMENFIQIAVPLKHPEDTYILTHNPEFSGLIVRLYSLEVHWYSGSKKCPNVCMFSLKSITPNRI